jgi:hypothetical protein
MNVTHGGYMNGLEELRGDGEIRGSENGSVDEWRVAALGSAFECRIRLK